MRAALALAIALAIALPAEAQQMSRRNKNAQVTGDPNEAFRLIIPPAVGGTLRGTRGEAITLDRAASKYCPQAVGTVTVVGSNAPCIYDGKLLIEGGSTNVAIASDAIGGGSWSNTNVTVSADAAATPWAAATMDQITSSSAGGKTAQTIVVSSSTGPFTHAAWGRSASGTHSAGIGLTCVSSTPSACICRREDGATCTATIASAECRGESSFTTTPTRVWVTATCTGAVTSVTATLAAGTFAADSGESHIWGGAQVEVRRYPTTYAPTTVAAVARLADIFTIPTTSSWPIATGAMSVTITPLWYTTAGPTGDVCIMCNPYNSFPVQGWANGVTNNGLISQAQVLNGSPSSVQTTFAQTWNYGQPYWLRYTWNAAGVVSFMRDGAAVAHTATHNPAAMATSIKNPMQLGGNFNGYIDAWVSSLCVARTTDGCTSQTVAGGTLKPIFWVSDSIYNVDELSTVVAERYSHGVYRLDNVRATYGGQVAGSGLIDLADKTYAYRGSSWDGPLTRGTPFSYFDALVFEFGRNDSGSIGSGSPETVTSFRQAYDKIVAQGIKYFPKVVSGTPPPKTNEAVTAFDTAGDDYTTLSLSAELASVATKYNVSHVDNYNGFLAQVSSSSATVPQLMRDMFHQSYALGSTRMGDWIYAALTESKTPIAATPELTGEVVNYLWGQPTVGSWSFVGAANTVGPYDSPIPRISGQTDQGLTASASGAKVTFPATEAKQVWVHYFRRTDGGNFTIYVDRGTGAQVSLAVNTSHVYHMYPQALLVSGTLAGGAHAIEIETTNASPVSILGVTVVKA
jgi:hypothetical protein